MFKKAAFILAATQVLASCDLQNDGSEAVESISVTQIGQQKIENRRSYSSIGDVSFTASKKYKLRNESSVIDNQLLLANITIWAGEVLERETQPNYFPLKDGEFEFDCEIYVSIRTNEEDHWGPLRCEIEPIAVFRSDAGARLVASSGNTQSDKPQSSTTESGETK